jgi:hypothetical protein
VLVDLNYNLNIFFSIYQHFQVSVVELEYVKNDSYNKRVINEDSYHLIST